MDFITHGIAHLASIHLLDCMATMVFAVAWDGVDMVGGMVTDTAVGPMDMAALMATAAIISDPVQPSSLQIQLAVQG